jgi:hypothetical protein
MCRWLVLYRPLGQWPELQPAWEELALTTYSAVDNGSGYVYRSEQWGFNNQAPPPSSHTTLGRLVGFLFIYLSFWDKVKLHSLVWPGLVMYSRLALKSRACYLGLYSKWDYRQEQSGPPLISSLSHCWGLNSWHRTYKEVLYYWATPQTPVAVRLRMVPCFRSFIC